jgi:hypothetical protein
MLLYEGTDSVRWKVEEDLKRTITRRSIRELLIMFCIVIVSNGYENYESSIPESTAPLPRLRVGTSFTGRPKLLIARERRLNLANDLEGEMGWGPVFFLIELK